MTRPAGATELSMTMVWVILGVMLLVVAAPLLRPGLPATRVGVLPLAWLRATPLPPEVAATPGESVLLAVSRLAAPVLGALGAYKLLLALGLIAGTAGIALAGRDVGGRAGMLLAGALYLFLPLLAAALYIVGRPGWLWAWALWPWVVAAASQRRRGAGVWLAGAALLAGLALAIGGIGSTGQLTPAELFGARWPANETVAAWLSLPVRQPGFPLLALALVTAWLAFDAPTHTRRAVFMPFGLAGILAASTLLPLPALDLRLLLAALLLVRGCAALPALEPALGRLPWLAVPVALVALMGYAQLAPAFHDSAPDGAPVAFFGAERLALVSAEVAGVTADPPTVAVTTTWQVTRPPSGDYTAFVHVVRSASSAIVGQQDRLLLYGERPSSQWLVGELVTQQYTITLASEAAGAPYGVLTGLYRLESGERLPRWPEGDSVEVAP